MNKTSKIYLICLLSGFLLISGVLVSQAMGFFTYEDGDKFVLWANTRITNEGLKLSNLGADETERVPSGIVKINDKDFFIRGFMAFNCINYPSQISCTTTFGDIGGKTFLRTNTLGSTNIQSLTLTSDKQGIDLQGDTISLDGNVLLTNNKNLIVSEQTLAGITPNKAVIATTVRIKELTNNSAGLNMPNLQLIKDAIFNPQSILSINLLQF